MFQNPFNKKAPGKNRALTFSLLLKINHCRKDEETVTALPAGSIAHSLFLK